MEVGIDAARQSPAREVVTVITYAVELGIKSPLFLPRFRIQRNDAVERGGNVERVLYHQGRSLKRALGPYLVPVPCASAVGNVAGVISPRDFEILNVFFGNLSERRIARASRIVAVSRPFFHGG